LNILSYEEFEKVMNGIVNELKFQNKIHSAVSELGFDCEYFRYVPTIDSTLMLLNRIFKDDSEYPLIDYWVFELNCGEDWKQDSVVDDDGNSIPLKTISNLYDELVRQYASK